MKSKIRIGSRSSELALWQTNHVKFQLEQFFPEVDIEIELIKTTGDKILDAPLAKIGDKGLFTKELDTALLQGRIDLAIHSLKDIPTSITPGLTISAILKRGDVRDVFIAHPKKSNTKFIELLQGSIIATGSLRRKCQLLHVRPDLNIVDLRGNLNTRLRKLDESNWDGIILAFAGVTRLGWALHSFDVLPLEYMLPAVGQGALAIETRQDDIRIINFVKTLHDPIAEDTVIAERALLRHLEGGCQIPIGAYSRIEGEIVFLDAVVGSIDGKKTIRSKESGPRKNAELVGIQLAKKLLQQGASEILAEIRHIT